MESVIVIGLVDHTIARKNGIRRSQLKKGLPAGKCGIKNTAQKTESLAPVGTLSGAPYPVTSMTMEYLFLTPAALVEGARAKSTRPSFNVSRLYMKHTSNSKFA
jgi:hypothetical protein